MNESEFPNELIRGYLRFREGRLDAQRARYRELAEVGQKPRTMVNGCCDSRAAPETIFDCGPGELFVVRNVANLVPPYTPDGDFHGTSAALEFAVQVLRVDLAIHGAGFGIATGELWVLDQVKGEFRQVSAQTDQN